VPPGPHLRTLPAALPPPRAAYYNTTHHRHAANACACYRTDACPHLFTTASANIASACLCRHISFCCIYHHTWRVPGGFRTMLLAPLGGAAFACCFDRSPWSTCLSAAHAAPLPPHRIRLYFRRRACCRHASDCIAASYLTQHYCAPRLRLPHRAVSTLSAAPFCAAISSSPLYYQRDISGWLLATPAATRCLTTFHAAVRHLPAYDLFRVAHTTARSRSSGLSRYITLPFVTRRLRRSPHISRWAAS